MQGPRSVTVAYGSAVEMDGVRGVLTPLVLEPATAAISVLTLERVGGTERNLKAPGTLAPSDRWRGPGPDPNLVSELVALPDLILDFAERFR